MTITITIIIGLLEKIKVMGKFLGPGLLVSIAYLDPGNLLSDIQSGATFNYRMIWVLCIATFLGFLMQVLSSRLGIVTGNVLNIKYVYQSIDITITINIGLHVALLCHEEYGDKTFLTISLWLLSELAIITSDILEVVGSAFGIKLIIYIYIY